MLFDQTVNTADAADANSNAYDNTADTVSVGMDQAEGMAEDAAEVIEDAVEYMADS